MPRFLQTRPKEMTRKCVLRFQMYSDDSVHAEQVPHSVAMLYAPIPRSFLCAEDAKMSDVLEPYTPSICH